MGQLDRRAGVGRMQAEQVRARGKGWLVKRFGGSNAGGTLVLSLENLTARMATLVPLPSRQTTRYCGAFAPNATLWPLVVQAGAPAPCRPTSGRRSWET